MKNKKYHNDAFDLKKEVVVLGQLGVGGTYVLRMEIQRDLRVRFGRFMQGKQIGVSKGTYVYIGSAMRSWEVLGRRLVRHATRSGAKSSHFIREQIVGVFGGGVLPKGEKRLRWHVDYLVERREVQVVHICALCSQKRLESTVADALLADEQVVAFAVGLGASDAPNKTHLLRVPNALDWWLDWVMRFQEIGLR